MQQHSLFNEKWRLGFIFKYDLNSVFKAALVLSIIIFGIFTLITLLDNFFPKSYF